MGIYIDEELTFKNHVNEKKNKDNKDIGIIYEMSMKISLRFLNSLPLLCKAPSGLCDVICEHPENEGFSNKIEIV